MIIFWCACFVCDNTGVSWLRYGVGFTLAVGD